MIELGQLSRRSLLSFLGLSLTQRMVRASDVLEIDRVAGDGPRGVATTYVRRYRVHATIHLLSVPLFNASNVGGCSIMVEHAVTGSARLSSIQLVSGSWPDRLKGFNRFGMAQEAVREEAGAVAESAYLSFMTSSAEKNLDQAKKSFSERGASQAISAAHGRAVRSGYASALDHLAVPARESWADCPRLMTEMRGRLSPLKEAVATASQGSAYLPFLHSVSSAMTAKSPAGESEFVHNAKLYRLRTKISPIPEGFLLVGKISEPGTNQESLFRVWFDPRDVSGLPLRFEFRPKSFLHLVYEQDPAVNVPKLSTLIAQEQA